MNFAASPPLPAEPLFYWPGEHIFSEGGPYGTRIITAWAGVGIGVGQLLLIGWGLRQMGKTSEERNRKMDQQAEALRQQGQMIAELLRRSNPA